MKKSIFISILVAAMGVVVLSGCQKKSSCEGGMQGYLQVLDEPYKTGPGFYTEDVKITAHFYQNKNLEGYHYCITGNVPKRLSPNDLVIVKLSVVYPDEDQPHPMTIYIPIYKLDCYCIEKE